MLQMGGQSWPATQAFYADDARQRARAVARRTASARSSPAARPTSSSLDSHATPAMAHRMESHEGDLEEELFVLMTMGDDRAVRETYVA